MVLHGGLAEALRLRVGIGDEDVTLDADRRAAGKLRLGLRRAAALCQRRLEGVDVVLGAPSGPSVTKCKPCSPAQVEPIVFDEPYQKAGCGCCSGRSAIGTSA